MPCLFAVSIQLLYASWSHVVTTVVTAPLERVVYILQTQDDNPRIRRTTDSQGVDSIAPYSGDVIPTLMRLAKEQGVQSWWHGNGVRILHLTLDQFLSQYVYTVLMTRLFAPPPNNNKNDESSNMTKQQEQQKRQQQQQRQVMAGIMAGLVSFTILYPLEVAVFRLSCHVGKDKQYLGGSLKTNYSASMTDLRDLWPGWGTAIIGVMVRRVVELEGARRLYQVLQYYYPEGSSLRPAPAHAWVWQQAVEMLATLVSYPFLTMSRRRQLQHVHTTRMTASPTNATKNLGALSTYNNQQNLYAGIGVGILQVVTRNVVLGLYHSEYMSRFDFLRRIMMKLFH